MKNVKHIIVSGVYVLLAVFATVSCTEGNDWEINSTYDRLFGTTETKFSITPAENAAQAEASWKATPNTTHYVIELSTNPLTDEVEIGTEGNIVFGNGIEKITTTTYLLEDLQPETEYYARIKSVGEGKESKWIYYDKGGTFKTKKEQILKTPSELTESSIRVTWEENCTVTSLRVFNEQKGYDQTILLEYDALEACAFTVRGLAPLTTYTIEIYNGEKLRGSMAATTSAGKMSEVSVSNIGKTSADFAWTEVVADGYAVVNDGSVPTAPQVALQSATSCQVQGLNSYTTYTFYLFKNGNIVGTATFTTQRDYPAGYQKVNIASQADWDAAITANYSNGNVVFVIPEGANWDLTSSTAKLTDAQGLKNVVFWGEGTTKPKLKMTLTMEGNLGTVEFYNLELSSTKNASGWNKTYLINYQNNNMTVGEIKVEGCEITEAGVAIRVKMEQGGTFGKITVNNTIFRNCHEALIGVNEVKDVVTINGPISVTNSTIANPEAYIIRSSNHQLSFNVENCTFYGSPGKNTIIDDNKKGSTISIVNSLFGGTTSQSMKLYSDGATLSKSENVFSASDFAWSKTEYKVTSTGITTSEMFPNAANDTFETVAAYKAYGDPRWNK